MLGLATIVLIVPFVRVGTSPAALAAALGIATLTLLGFLQWERAFEARGHAAVLTGALRRARQFTLGSAVAMCWFAAQMAQLSMISLFLIVQLGLTPLVTAIITLGGSLGMGLASTRSWRFLGRFGRPGITACLVAQAVTSGVLVVIAGHLSDGGLIAVIVVQQLAMGLTNGCIEGPNRSLTLGGAPAGSNGVAGGVLQLGQRLAATVCIAAVTAPRSTTRSRPPPRRRAAPGSVSGCVRRCRSWQRPCRFKRTRFDRAALDDSSDIKLTSSI